MNMNFNTMIRFVILAQYRNRDVQIEKLNAILQNADHSNNSQILEIEILYIV